MLDVRRAYILRSILRNQQAFSMAETSNPRCCQFCDRAVAVQYERVLDPQSLEPFQILVCSQCRHGQTWPVPATMDAYYGPQYHGGRHGFTSNYCARRRLRLVSQVAGQGGGRRLLDVGCGDGTFLLGAARAGWAVTGTEMNPDAARAEGLDVYRSVSELSGQAPFDCITLWHVLEHFADPLAELCAIRELLATSGVLVLAVPDADGTQARVWGPYWMHRDVPRHLHHFSRHSLELHLNNAGFTVERWWHGEFEYDLLGWSQSALNRSLPPPNAFFQILTGRETGTRPVNRFVHTSLGTLFCGLGLLPTWWGMLFGRSGTLIVAARPAGQSPRKISGTGI